jgi:hypothetical protein
MVVCISDNNVFLTSKAKPVRRVELTFSRTFEWNISINIRQVPRSLGQEDHVKK